MVGGYFFWLNWIWIGVAIITFVMLVAFNIKAPYGRHTRAGWGKLIPNHLGWFWMELPAFLICPLLAIFGPAEKSLATYLLAGMWMFHYFNRTFIFPFRLRTKGKSMPISIVLSAIFFNVINGLLNGFYLGYVGSSEELSIAFFGGAFIFFTGFSINYIADQKLIALREGGDGYHIPRGWLFRWISCPNHFGEIIEWIGFAVAAGSLPAVTFAIWTFSNLAPRAFNHHEWYKSHFPDYPTKRKALIPFII